MTAVTNQRRSRTTWRHGLAAAALAAGVVGGALVATPAQAGGDTERIHGCAAHWRNTANWNECQNADVTIQLQVNCVGGRSIDWVSEWMRVAGTRSPVSRFECTFQTSGAWNAFSF